MSGRGGWAKVRVVGRPARLPEIPRSPVSWWLEPEYQQNRDHFYQPAEEEQPRMAHRGMSPDRLEWKS